MNSVTGPSPAKHPRPQEHAPEYRTSIVVVRDREGLTPFVGAWQALAVTAIEPNAFYEPWMLLPAISAFGQGSALEFVLVFAEGGGAAGPLLIGFFPLERQHRYGPVPVTTLSLWQHPYCYLCTPLLRAGHAREALLAYLDWLSEHSGAPLMMFRRVAGDGPFHHVFIDVLNARQRLSVTRSYTRALFRPLEDAEIYLSTALKVKRRKEFKRQEKRLSELGHMEYTLLGPGGDAAAWIRDFLDLEARGWKGRHGTAFASQKVDQRYFEQVAGLAEKEQRLMMLGLNLGGRPVALKCNFLSGEGSFAFKIAYDESYARFSPGVLLELENIRRLHLQTQVRWMDSGAVADHFMINRLWLHRRTIHSVLVDTGRRPGGFLVSVLPLVRWLRRTLRPAAPAPVPAGDEMEEGK